MMQGNATPVIQSVFGAIAGDWTVHIGSFFGCTALSDYGSLPNYWKGW
jgi:succinate-acetate transporter protein